MESPAAVAIVPPQDDDFDANRLADRARAGLPWLILQRLLEQRWYRLSPPDSSS